MAAKQTNERPGNLPLDAAVDHLLENPDLAANWLSTADKYMQAYNENQDGFILPREHLFLKPIIDAFAHDLGRYVEFIVSVRDCLPKDSAGWERTQGVYRRIMGRHTQKVRRVRADRAIAKAEELYGETDFHTRLKWVSDLEHGWAKRRLDYLADRRAKTENNRLSSEERAEALLEFWDEIDTEINEGKVPPWT
jgi:hypothetical protein